MIAILIPLSSLVFVIGVGIFLLRHVQEIQKYFEKLEQNPFWWWIVIMLLAVLDLIGTASLILKDYAAHR